MAEWLILLLLVPAVVVPVVLLVGFAGCDQLFELQHVNPSVPAIVSANGKSGSVISLTWTYPDMVTEIEFERVKEGDQTGRRFKATANPHDDDNEGDGLTPETRYLYRVRAIESDGEPGESPDTRINASVRRDLCLDRPGTSECRT